MKKKKVIIITIAILVAICLKPFVVISIKNMNISKEQWVEDINYLQEKLPKVHTNPFSKIDQKDFDAKIEALKGNINNLNSDEITIQLMNIIASVGDAHTDIKNFKSNYIFPFTIYKFNDGYYLTVVDDKYKNLLGSKVLTINNIPIEDVINKVSVLIPHENEAMVISKAPDYLQDPKVISYLTNSKDSLLHVTLLDSKGKNSKMDIEAVKSSTLKMSSLSDSIINKPIYMKNNNNFWYEYLEGQKTLYCQFNLCLVNTPSQKDLSSINDIVKANKIEKVIIDLRNNVGGLYISDNNAFINAIKNNSQINVNNKLFVIIGRKTFSSGMQYALGFKQQTNAILYGEATSGKPSHYGNVKTFNLPNSKLNITYSTKYFETQGFNSDSLKPDVEIDTDINSYAKGIDPVVESIINYQK